MTQILPPQTNEVATHFHYAIAANGTRVKIVEISTFKEQVAKAPGGETVMQATETRFVEEKDGRPVRRFEDGNFLTFDDNGSIPLTHERSEKVWIPVSAFGRG